MNARREGEARGGGRGGRNGFGKYADFFLPCFLINSVRWSRSSAETLVKTTCRKNKTGKKEREGEGGGITTK